MEQLPPHTHKFTKHFKLLSGSDVDLFSKSINMGVKVNGKEISLDSLPYQHPIGYSPLHHPNKYLYILGGGEVRQSQLCSVLLAKIQIRSKDEGISVYAPSLGLHEVYVDRNIWKVLLHFILQRLR